jgi:hypothetical protein
MSVIRQLPERLPSVEQWFSLSLLPDILNAFPELAANRPTLDTARRLAPAFVVQFPGEAARVATLAGLNDLASRPDANQAAFRVIDLPF